MARIRTRMHVNPPHDNPTPTDTGRPRGDCDHNHDGCHRIWSSIAFSLWHWSAVVLKTGFDPPRAQVPVFMVNAMVMGAVWGLLRWISGSVIVSSVSHGLWNGIAYVFFGFGTKVGALGVKNTGLFGPEVGVLGLAVNLIFAAALWRWWKSRAGTAAST
jgi:hypothetical protein